MNEQLAELARERAARRRAAGAPPEGAASTTTRRPLAARSPNVSLPRSTSLLKCAGFAVLGWMLIARTNQGSCGCGPDGVRRMMDGVTGALSVDQGGDGADAGTALKGLGDMFRGLTETANEIAGRCKNPVASAVCTTACWQTGSDLQQQMWSACFRGWLRGEDGSNNDLFAGKGGTEL